MFLSKLYDGQILSIAQFMHLSSIENNHSFYQKQNPFSKDFVTAPVINSLFSEMIAIWILLTMQNNLQEKFILLELGAGNGQMMKVILETLQKFALNFEVLIYERSQFLRKVQQQTLMNFPNIQWIDDLNKIKNQKTLIVANEFFDALPINQFQLIDNIWHEINILYKNQQLHWITNIANPKFTAILPKNYQNHEIFEISLQSLNIIQFLTHHIQQNQGSMLIIDYGYINSMRKNTLRAIQNNKFVNFLDDPGNIDLSAFVDFQALKNHQSLKNHILITQNEFLQKMGIKERYQQLLSKKHDNTLFTESLNKLMHMENFFTLIIQEQDFNY